MHLAWQIAKTIKHVLFIFHETKNFIQTYTGNADKLSKKKGKLYID